MKRKVWKPWKKKGCRHFIFGHFFISYLSRQPNSCRASRLIHLMLISEEIEQGIISNLEIILLRCIQKALAAGLKGFLIKNGHLYLEKKLIIKKRDQKSEIVSHIHHVIGD